MAHFKKLIERENAGKLTYGNYIVSEIVEIAVSEVPYVKLYTGSYNQSYGINVYSDKDGVHIGVVVKVHYTQSISDIAFKIQETVRHNVESMTEYHVANVNVSVKDVYFDEDTSTIATESAEVDTDVDTADGEPEESKE